MSGIIGGAGSKSGVIIPPVVGCRVQPNGSSLASSIASGDHTLGWSASHTNSAIRGCFISGITFSAHSGSYIHDGNNTGKVTFQYSGQYWYSYDIRVENNPLAGNLRLDFNGSHMHRMHVEGWAHHPYMHATLRGTLDVKAGDYARFYVSCQGGNIQGHADSLNYLNLMRVQN